MPTYEYRCGTCGAVTEAVQAFTDSPLTRCPQCGQETLRKRFGNVGVVFKGSGFYRNDSRTDGRPKSRGGDSAAPADKPAAKSDEAAKGSDGAGSSSSAKGGESTSAASSKAASRTPAQAGSS